MNNIEVKQITQADDNTLNTITKWMYNWWEKKMDIYLKKYVSDFDTYRKKPRIQVLYKLELD